MTMEEKIQNPISIRIGDTMNVMLEKEGVVENTSLSPGIMFGGDHYGFVLISDINGIQRETIYPTQCTIQAIGMENGILKVFEDGKNLPWLFDRKGRIERSAVDDFTFEALCRADLFVSHPDMFLDRPVLLNPVRIQIARNPEKSVILRDDVGDCDYPLYPGAMLGGLHYGFLLIIESDDGSREIAYPTHNRIDAVGVQDKYEGDIRVFEEGKYHPWLFSAEGKLKKESSYNPYSRKDKRYVSERFGLDNPEDHFQLFKKKDK